MRRCATREKRRNSAALGTDAWNAVQLATDPASLSRTPVAPYSRFTVLDRDEDDFGDGLADIPPHTAPQPALPYARTESASRCASVWWCSRPRYLDLILARS